ncbi:polysaccharide deacetylase family protein [Haloarcula salina]|uniref:polysaccharide deacetylase family protein n=1 Tax=Haloarcula salina TaxID=1429914 RepID=UPI003C6F26AE
MYHSVGDSGSLSITEREFQTQLAFLDARYRFVTLSEIVTKNDKESVALTFDDGYRDFYDTALPILRENDIPATVFVVGSSLTEGKVPGFRKPTMTIDQLCELADDPLITLGNHTQSHQDLTSLPQKEQKNEIIHGKRIIEDQVGVCVSQFAYPGGAYDDHSVSVVKDTHDCAVTVDKPWSSYSNHTLPRIHAHDAELVRWGLNSTSHLLHR